MELKPITISFKDTADERAIYEEICKHSSKGAFIKDVLIQVLLRQKENTPVTKTEDYNAEISDIFESL
jgi:hypothetical protein